MLAVAEKSLHYFYYHLAATSDSSYHQKLKDEFNYTYPRSMIVDELAGNRERRVYDLRILLCMAHYLSSRNSDLDVPVPEKLPHETNNSKDRLEIIRKWWYKCSGNELSWDKKSDSDDKDDLKVLVRFLGDKIIPKICEKTERISDELFTEMNAYYNEIGSDDKQRNLFLGPFGTDDKWQTRSFTQTQAIVSATIFGIPYLSSLHGIYNVRCGIHPLFDLYDCDRDAHLKVLYADMYFEPYVARSKRTENKTVWCLGGLSPPRVVNGKISGQVLDQKIPTPKDRIDVLAQRMKNLYVCFSGGSSHMEIMRYILQQDPSQREALTAKYKEMCQTYIDIMKTFRIVALTMDGGDTKNKKVQITIYDEVVPDASPQAPPQAPQDPQAPRVLAAEAPKDNADGLKTEGRVDEIVVNGLRYKYVESANKD